MRSGLRIGRQFVLRRQRERPTRRLLDRYRRAGRWRNGGKQNHTADAPRLAITREARRPRLPDQGRLTDDDVRGRSVDHRGAYRRQACDQAGQRDRIGGRERNNAPKQRPVGETLMHDRAQFGTTPQEDSMLAAKGGFANAKFNCGSGSAATRATNLWRPEGRLSLVPFARHLSRLIWRATLAPETHERFCQ